MFSLFSHKTQDFRKKKVYWRKYVFVFLYNSCLKHFSFWEEMIEIRSLNLYRYSCKVSFILARFQWNLKFLRRFSIITQKPNFTKSAQWALSFTKRTDRGRQAWWSWYSLYRNFANAIQIWLPVTSVLRRKELTYTEKGNKLITIIFIITVIICLDIVIFFLYQQWSLLFKFEASDCITSLIMSCSKNNNFYYYFYYMSWYCHFFSIPTVITN